MPGQKRDQMCRDANGSHAGTAAAVRDAEGFVQVQMADVRADVAGTAEADLGVHVRAVHVDLPAVAMDDLADFLDGFLEHAVRGRIGDHQRSEIVRDGLRPWSRRSSTSILPSLVAGNGHDFHAGHDGAGGIGAMRGGRDEADRRDELRRAIA